MHFAARTSFDPEPSPYGTALSKARAHGGLVDLTVSNPTRCGFHFATDLLHGLSDPTVLRYYPDPMGLRSTREALSRMYAERDQATIPADHIVLTASTSESYGYLLRLFCEPGDNILIPSPSYPLFDLLGALHDVEVRSYALQRHDGWGLDTSMLQGACTARTRAIVVIHPNNPTGHFCTPDDRRALLEFASEHDLPLIVDEVFLEYGLESAAPSFLSSNWPLPAATDHGSVLTFTLGGVSKLLCLPQMKLGWMAVQGQPQHVSDALARLEIISDTFLSVGTPPQVALPAWLPRQGETAIQVRQRTRDNLAVLDLLLLGSTISRLRVEAGWTVVLRVPSLGSDEELAVRLLHEARVAVHPGSLYGFGSSGWLVCSLLPSTEEFSRGISALLRFFATQAE